MQSVMFRNRIEAAKELAKRLKWLKEVQLEDKAQKNKCATVVVAIPRGGIIIGDIIASELGTKLDLVVSRKIGAPFNPELAIGAVMPDGTCFLNASRVEALRVTQQYIAAQTAEQMKEIDRRLVSYRGRRGYDKELEDKI